MATFYEYPLNYGGGRSQYREVADNDYKTATTQTAMLLNIDTAGDGTGAARPFTDIFIKGSGIVSYTAQFTDGANIPNPSPFPRTLPTNVKNDSGDMVSITDLDGFQNDLFNISTDEGVKPQAKGITLSFTGTNVRVAEVMVLNRLLTIDSDGGFSRIEYDSIDLGVVETDMRRRLSYVPPIGGERDKWLVRLSALSLRRGARDTIADSLISFIRRYKNFVFAPEYYRYPDRVFPALCPYPETQIRYLSRWKGSGRRVLFSVREA